MPDEAEKGQNEKKNVRRSCWQREWKPDGDGDSEAYLELEGKPVLYYCLHVFQESRYIDEIVLVTGEREIDYCREKIVTTIWF